MNTKSRASSFLACLSITVAIILTSFAPAIAFQNNYCAHNCAGLEPADPDASFIALLGRYENIRDTRETLLILEDSGALVMQREKSRSSLEPSGPMNYLASGRPEGPETTVTFSGAFKNGASYCITGGRFIYRRLKYGTESGGTYRIVPLKPIDALRKTAFAAVPPREPDLTLECELVDLRKTGINLRFDIRYATRNNFMGEKFYDSEDAFLQRPAAIALSYVERALARHGFGMIVYDAYRPWHVTKMFYDATPDAQKNFVADPAKGSKHNRGTAIDVGLYYLSTGELADMGSGYDEFSERAFPCYEGGTTASRWRRKLLERYMNRAGFTVFEDEWWHFDYRPKVVKYPIQNIEFAKIKNDHRQK